MAVSAPFSGLINEVVFRLIVYYVYDSHIRSANICSSPRIKRRNNQTLRKILKLCMTSNDFIGDLKNFENTRHVVGKTKNSGYQFILSPKKDSLYYYSVLQSKISKSLVWMMTKRDFIK